MPKLKGLVDYEDDEDGNKECDKWSSPSALSSESKKISSHKRERDTHHRDRRSSNDNSDKDGLKELQRRSSSSSLSSSDKRRKDSSRDRRDSKDRVHQSRRDTDRGKDVDRKSSSRRSDDERRRSSHHKREKKSLDSKRSRSRSPDDYKSNHRDRSKWHHSSDHRSDDKAHRDEHHSKQRSNDNERNEEKRKVSISSEDSINKTSLDKADVPSLPVINPPPQPLISSLPKYYKPSSVNPTKFALQEEKRKLLWGNGSANKSQSLSKSSKVWENLQFSGAQGQQMTEKFRKLMGIKSSNTSEEPKSESQETALKKQEHLFRDLDKQYSMARMSTHTHRGTGLGFSSNPITSKPGSSQS